MVSVLDRGRVWHAVSFRRRVAVKLQTIWRRDAACDRWADQRCSGLVGLDPEPFSFERICGERDSTTLFASVKRGPVRLDPGNPKLAQGGQSGSEFALRC